MVVQGDIWYTLSMLNSSNKLPPIDRFWRSVKKTKGCWLWTAGKDTNGYGQFSIKSVATSVHRFSYELHFGEIKHDNTYHGICVLHKCDTPSCVNPDHLVLGTQLDNIKDRDSKMRMAHKISRETAEKIRGEYIPYKVSQYTLGKKYGISRGTVEDIIHKRIWK
jgi:hypothetical protein